MNRFILRVTMGTLTAVVLAGCGGGSDPTASTPAKNQSALHQAYLDNPDLALQIAPTSGWSSLSETQNQAQKLSARSAIKLPAPCIPFTGGSSGDLATTYSVADLQANYEKQFCQLDSALGVTLQTPQCQSNISYIQQQSGAGHFDLTAKPILNNPLGVTGVKFAPLTYTTRVDLPQGQQTYTVSGGLMLPQGISGDKIKGVITYFHGTTFNKCTVGSNYIATGETQLVAEVFASQGYVVIIPDYIGQGVDWQNVHPYVLYPKASAKTAVDMLEAVSSTIRKEYQLDARAQLKLFSAGYSEGGAYSLWFSSYIHDQPGVLNPLYQLKHAVGMEGAYATSTVTKGYLFDNVSQDIFDNIYNIQTQVITNLVKPLLSADAFLSYATYQLNGDTTSVFNTDFYNLNFVCASFVPQKICQFFQFARNMAQEFAQQAANAAPPVFFSALGKTANEATYPNYETVVQSSKNSANSLVSPTLLSPTGQQQLDAALRAADVNLGSLPDKAVSIISLDKDSVVTSNNYKTLLANYPSKIRDAYLIPANHIQVVSYVSQYVGTKPEYVDTDHLHALIYEFLYALNTFNKY